MKYSRKLKLIRKQMGLTQQSLANMFGTTAAQISRIENETAEIPKEIILWLDQQSDVDTPQNDVGQRLAELRKDLGMTRNQFGEYVGCAGSTISRLESGKNPIELPLATRIAEKCRVGVEWLLYADETKKMWPVDGLMENFLWNHPEIRKEICRMMDEE